LIEAAEFVQNDLSETSDMRKYAPRGKKSDIQSFLFAPQGKIISVDL
jgi:hypothetical protein